MTTAQQRGPSAPAAQQTASVAPQAQPLPLPERPALAAGVTLAGQMQESAFKDPPWLIEREGAGYVQVTELLYKVAEQCTGRQTYQQIAEALGAKGTPIRPETVQRLVAQMLLPLGLVAAADGSVARGTAQRGSILALNMRMKMVSPRVFGPIAAVLQYLFWPPLLITLLLTSIAAQGWVLAVHGLAAGAREALYTPGLLLIILALTILSAAFHELGHAAALRYAGSEARAMGAGLYLIYPAFYTDVSGNYRLRRWPRVRTDLAGFYFNLVFSLVVIGVYLLTHAEFLLIVAFLADFEIFYQMMPFVRLDGYWALADITGIPDFFSQMTAFWRTILPIGRWKGQRLPELYWWGKLVFILYSVVTVPLLLFVLFTMLRTLPRVLGTAVDSGSKLFGQVVTNAGHANILMASTDTVQIVLLALPTIGMLIVLFTLAKRLVHFGWSWSRPSLGRKAITGCVGAGLVALLVFLWLPQLPPIPSLAGRRTPESYAANFQPIQPDERGTIRDAVPVFSAWPPAAAAPVTPRTEPGAATAPVTPARQVATATTTVVMPNSEPGAASAPVTPARQVATTTATVVTPSVTATRQVGLGTAVASATPQRNLSATPQRGTQPAAVPSARPPTQFSPAPIVTPISSGPSRAPVNTGPASAPVVSTPASGQPSNAALPTVETAPSPARSVVGTAVP